MKVTVREQSSPERALKTFELPGQQPPPPQLPDLPLPKEGTKLRFLRDKGNWEASSPWYQVAAYAYDFGGDKETGELDIHMLVIKV